MGGRDGEGVAMAMRTEADIRARLKQYTSSREDAHDVMRRMMDDETTPDVMITEWDKHIAMLNMMIYELAWVLDGECYK